jgi:DNA-binding PadR family transcriptional regulator
MNKEDENKPKVGTDAILLSPARLPIITLLAMYDEVDFTFLKSELSMSDGNLGANLKKLEDEGFLGCKKTFVGRKPKTIYTISSKGLNRLKDFIQSMKNIESRLVES